MIFRDVTRLLNLGETIKFVLYLDT